ncbi:hypothetical protein DL89DRAFT_280848 [Linderina pennispora]|uniref:Uncharacterized protein n=1 Tax=Linderina pennispora TaxID=61395 RepID=A0A1Y1WMB7_9FUNG|nr:uncharacterized protein DL89DRAFT_280848 [Linderina pennispora]ORX74438.1 hypothetical protein DL89DRAFT_280848 [Linderina pennispora]
MSPTTAGCASCSRRLPAPTTCWCMSLLRDARRHAWTRCRRSRAGPRWPCRCRRRDSRAWRRAVPAQKSASPACRPALDVRPPRPPVATSPGAWAGAAEHEPERHAGRTCSHGPWVRQRQATCQTLRFPRHARSSRCRECRAQCRATNKLPLFSKQLWVDAQSPKHVRNVNVCVFGTGCLPLFLHHRFEHSKQVLAGCCTRCLPLFYQPVDCLCIALLD